MHQVGTLPFLNTLVSPGPSKSLITTVYRKPTHTNQYLHWNNNHFITAKHSVFNTLAHRAKVPCTSQQAVHKEMEHIRKALQACLSHHGLSTLYKTDSLQKQHPQ